MARKKESTTSDNSVVAMIIPTDDKKDKATKVKAKSPTPVPVKFTAKPNTKNAPTKAYPKVKIPEPKPVTITRLELAAEVSKAVGRVMEITGKDAESIVAEIIQSMIDSLKEGNEIEVRGFGSFRIRKRNARRGRNPKTGESVDVPSKRVVYFKMGKELKQNFIEK